jgi:hypothetical protein
MLAVFFSRQVESRISDERVQQGSTEDDKYPVSKGGLIAQI